MRPIRFLFLLAVAWLVVELAALPVAGRVLEQQVSARTRGVSAVDAKIGSFPVIARYVATGRINNVDVTLDRIVRLGLTFAKVRLNLVGVAVDRPALLRRQVHITDIERGTVTATIDISGLPPRLAALAERNIRVAGRTLVIGPVSFQLSSELLPCDPQVRLLGSQVIATCPVTGVPSILLDASQRR